MKASASSIIHLNVTGFFSALALLKDPALRKVPFVIAAPSARALVLDVSPCAKKEGLEPGMSLGAAQLRVRSLQIFRPDILLAEKVGTELERISGNYAPLVENNNNGHLYLDVRGTDRLFGAAPDCAARIRGEILRETGLDASAAVASNKLTAKVMTRTLRPVGFAALSPGEEAAFLAAQDIALLPGISRRIGPMLKAAGIYNIGAMAELSDAQALALFGSKALYIRDAARGIDADPVRPGNSSEYHIREEFVFSEELLDGPLLTAALTLACGKAGLMLRRRRLAAGALRVTFTYADAVCRSAQLKARTPLILDQDIEAAAEQCRKAADRRIRLRSVAVELSDLVPDFFERDLFEADLEDTRRHLQKTLDSARTRYGTSILFPASALPVIKNHG